MKRSVSILLIFCIITSMFLCLLGCEKSKVDENQRILDSLHEGSEQAARRAEEARQEYEKLQKDWAEYQRLLGALGGGK